MALAVVILAMILLAGSLQQSAGEHLLLRLRRGFGCPYNELACYEQCVKSGKSTGFCGKGNACQCS
ncbi:uncharacterized protein LOC144166211 [Haemaphysalis longicornis]